ncbi:MAG: hypothetical protein ACRCTI_04115 [Beijerinckiaceae bacterium]
MNSRIRAIHCDRAEFDRVVTEAMNLCCLSATNRRKTRVYADTIYTSVLRNRIARDHGEWLVRRFVRLMAAEQATKGTAHIARRRLAGVAL